MLGHGEGGFLDIQDSHALCVAPYFDLRVLQQRSRIISHNTNFLYLISLSFLFVYYFSPVLRSRSSRSLKPGDAPRWNEMRHCVTEPSLSSIPTLQTQQLHPVNQSATPPNMVDNRRLMGDFLTSIASPQVSWTFVCKPKLSRFLCEDGFFMKWIFQWRMQQK